jgi:hypothetical protein
MRRRHEDNWGEPATAHPTDSIEMHDEDQKMNEEAPRDFDGPEPEGKADGYPQKGRDDFRFEKSEGPTNTPPFKKGFK